MSDPAQFDDHVRKERSPSFPFIGLDKAIARAQQMADNHRRSDARLAAVGTSWGYGPKSSGLLQTVAALKQYGLIDDLGAGADRKIKLSELAWRILLDTRPESKQQALKEAALRPRLIAEYFEKWGALRPSDAHCLSELQLDRGFTAEAAKTFLRVYDETISFAGPREDDALSSNLEEEPHPLGSPPPQYVRPTATTPNMPSAGSVMIATPTGTVTRPVAAPIPAHFQLQIGENSITVSAHLLDQEMLGKLIERLQAMKSFLPAAPSAGVGSADDLLQ